MILSVIGFLSGIISGMGIGGGTILIPALILFTDISQQSAQSVNLSAFLPTAIIAIVVHSKKKSIRYRLAAYMVLSGILGAVIGSGLAICLSSGHLRRLFGVFLLVISIYELFRPSN
ncbi:MAG: TSUP family transporter [Clostridia bacterium]|jgi:uncharacterized membrane protein YfcA